MVKNFIKYMQDNDIKISTSVNKGERGEYVILKIINREIPNRSFESNNLGIRSLVLNLSCYSDGLSEALEYADKVEDTVLAYENEFDIISVEIMGGNDIPLNSFNKYGWSFQTRILFYKEK